MSAPALGIIALIAACVALGMFFVWLAASSKVVRALADVAALPLVRDRPLNASVRALELSCDL